MQTRPIDKPIPESEVHISQNWKQWPTAHLGEYIILLDT